MIRDGGWHETELGRVERWRNQAPELYEAFIVQTEAKKDVDRALAALQQEVEKLKADVAHWKGRWASEGDARAQGWTDWTPSAANVNALPDALRSYVHQLETVCDPSGDQRELVIARDIIKALEADRQDWGKEFHAEATALREQLTTYQQTLAATQQEVERLSVAITQMRLTHGASCFAGKTDWRCKACREADAALAHLKGETP